MRLALIFSLLWTDDAFAYLDPGTGSIILQSAIAAIAAGLYAVKTYWRTIKSFLSSKFSKACKSKDNDNE